MKSKSAGSNQPRGASLPESGKSGSSTMGSTDAHPTHYHTVHGTSHIGHHHQCSNAITSHTSPATPDGACHGYNCKQRNRSHSGPVYPIAFPQSMRHTALISGGMATLGASSRRRQSDDSEQTSSSLRSRVSPSGSSFFDSFRYVPTYYCCCLFYSGGDHCSMTSHFLVIPRLCVDLMTAKADLPANWDWQFDADSHSWQSIVVRHTVRPQIDPLQWFTKLLARLKILFEILTFLSTANSQIMMKPYYTKRAFYYPRFLPSF